MKQQSKGSKFGQTCGHPKSSFLCKKYKKQPKTSQKWLVFGCFLVEVTGLEPAISSSRTMRDTTFATPRNGKNIEFICKWSNMWSDQNFTTDLEIGNSKIVSVFKGSRRFEKSRNGKR